MIDTLALTSDELEVVVLPELGARVHSIRAFGELITHSPENVSRHVDEPHHWGGYHLVPWCNRVTPGPVEVAGRTLDLRANFPDGTAIHGFHVDGPWEAAGRGRFVVEGGDRAGWPWPYAASVTFGVAGSALTVRYALTNRGDTPMPGGVGFHPWFRVPARVRIPAESVFPDNSATAPDPDPVSGHHDLRRPAPIEPGVDACWAGLDPAAVTLWWESPGLALEYSARRPDGGSILAVAAHLPEVRGAAVELQTHAPAGIRRLLAGEPYPIDLLAPGAALQLELRLDFSRT